MVSQEEIHIIIRDTHTHTHTHKCVWVPNAVSITQVTMLLLWSDMFLINDEGWGAVCLKMNHKTRHKPGSLHLTLILHVLYSLPLYLWETSFIEVNAVPRESSCDSHYNQLWPYLLLSPLRRCVWRKRGTLQQQPSSFRTGHFSVQLKGEWTDPVCFADADISVLLMNVRQV